MKGSEMGILHPSSGLRPWLPRERLQEPRAALTASILARCLICSPLIEQMRCRQRGSAAST